MAQGDKIKVTFYWSTNFVGANKESVVEWDREDWESMTDEDRDEAAVEWAYNNGLEVGWHRVEG